MYEEAKKIIEKSNLTDEEKLSLLLQIEPENALREAEEKKKYHIIVKYYIEKKDYDKAKEYIERAINDKADKEVNEIILEYKDIILKDKELSNNIAKYLLDIENIYSATAFYENMNDNLKDLLAEKIFKEKIYIWH